MQSLHDQVEEAEKRHSTVEEQVSCANNYRTCTCMFCILYTVNLIMLCFPTQTVLH